MSALDKIIYLYPLSSYKISVKSAMPEKDPSFQRLKSEYAIIGMRRSVKAVIVTLEHNLPHVLLLSLGVDFAKLPGGELYPGEDEVEGLKRILNETFGEENGVQCNWVIGDVIGNWWRPNYAPSIYPYIPAKVNKPREHKKLFLVQLEKNSVLAVPNNYTLMAAPVHDLFENSKRFGQIIANLPPMLSRYQFKYY